MLNCQVSFDLQRLKQDGWDFENLSNQRKHSRLNKTFRPLLELVFSRIGFSWKGYHVRQLSHHIVGSNRLSCTYFVPSLGLIASLHTYSTYVFSNSYAFISSDLLGSFDTWLKTGIKAQLQLQGLPGHHLSTANIPRYLAVFHEDGIFITWTPDCQRKPDW